jgi:hypothetical protein
MNNAATLERELDWAATVIETAMKLYFAQETPYRDIHDLTPPPIDAGESNYAHLLAQHAMDFDERLVLILALTPYLRPQLLDILMIKNTLYERQFTEFGGIHGVSQGAQSGFLPTVETAAFILAQDNLTRRLALTALFDAAHFFRRERILDLEAGTQATLFSAPLSVHREQLGWLTTGQAYDPDFSNSFPAKRLNTALEWSDLVLPDGCRDDVDEIRAWILHGPTLMHEWQLARQIKPGFRSLFYGPPGTGKTLTACLLGKVCALDVYRVDLSLVVSKYIGETEKNLSGVFDQAQSKNWILFFDEADALFGKRTQTSSSNDRYANQEVAYLLQRVEDFPGVVILATNLKNNIDDAFARRFQSMVYFPMPAAPARARLWRNAFARQGRLDHDVDLDAIAEEFEISGGAIINVLRYASLMALRRGTGSVSLADLRHGIRRELRKEGRII